MCRIIPVAVNQKIDQRPKLTLRQLEVFAAVARGGTTRAAADEISRSQSAASNALGELEAVLVQLFDRGQEAGHQREWAALLPRAAGILEQAVETEALFTAAHAASLRLAASYTIGEYLLPVLIARWKQANRAATCCWISPTRMTCSSGSPVPLRHRFHRGDPQPPGALGQQVAQR